jgi:IS30 family transposase
MEAKLALIRDQPARALWALGFEAIYAFIYRVAHKGEDLWRYLTRRHKRRRPRRSRSSRERPLGEGDLIICKRTRPVLVLHERKSRVTLAARLAGKTAAETISVMLAIFARMRATAILRLSYKIEIGTPLKNANAETWSSRKASVVSPDRLR